MPAYPARAATEVKIVWRMTGEGDLDLVALGPDGQTLDPAWGPESHSDSNWQRPGDEWGSGFRFPQPGCWQITARRGSDTAVAGVLVVS